MGGAGAGKELDEDVEGKMRRTDYGQVRAVSDFSWPVSLYGVMRLQWKQSKQNLTLSVATVIRYDAVTNHPTKE
jgi:hypothetical protein